MFSAVVSAGFTREEAIVTVIIIVTIATTYWVFTLFSFLVGHRFRHFTYISSFNPHNNLHT